MLKWRSVAAAFARQRICSLCGVISELVLREAAAGNPGASAKRLKTLAGLPVLRVTDESTDLAAALIVGGALPERAAVDAFHIAVATAHGVDYLLTWNCTHIANATMRGSIEAICKAEGFTPPVICTPEELPGRIEE